MATVPAEGVRAVVYTDLDGTLLDHDSYDWRPAAPALAALSARGVPVLPITSKTLAEMGPLRASIGLDDTPFAVENGGAICVPAGYFGGDAGVPMADGLFVQRLGPRYADILVELAHLRRNGFAFTGFADLDSDALAACTGLSPDAAAAAGRRLCSEPLLWQGDDAALALFRDCLAAVGLVTRRGGRFLHVMGPCDKGAALRWLQARFAAAGSRPSALALGDSDNDLDMLFAADHGYLVGRPDGGYAAAAHPPHIVHAGGIGPAGWVAAVDDWLARTDED